MTYENSNKSNGTPPVDHVRLGRISAAIWKQTSDDRSFYNFTLERSYKDDQGNYQSASSFSLQDALVVAKIASLADSRIRKLLDNDYAASQSAEHLHEDVG